MNACIAIFRQALDLDEALRPEFTRQACGDDAALHAQVLQLLALDAIPDRLLDQQADPLAVALLADIGTSDNLELDGLKGGDQIGSWRVLERLGAGGMGSVWLAEREHDGVRQRAALKCIKPGMDSAAVLRAFQRERELLVRLNHPGIANLIDSGIDASGRPWYAMRQIEGRTLDRWLDSAPSLRARLQLFVALCRIVAHAHRLLVIHRDLKPGNIMVQQDGSPCLLDFGIAKLLQDEHAQATATVMRFASTAYAAPEQLDGSNVSTASDVYALGAILFEMLCGQRYNTLAARGVINTRPSRVAKATGHAATAVAATRLKGDLDAITLRALADDPARRYGSVDALADDVARHLAGQPVLARPDGFGYRAAKWIGRNRLAFAGLLLAVLAMLAGTGISYWQASRAAAEAKRANTVKDYLIGLFDAGRTNVIGRAALDRRVIDVLDDSAREMKTALAGQPALRDELYGILIEIFDANAAVTHSVALAHERLEQAQHAFGSNDVRCVPALLMLAGVLLNHDQVDEVSALLQSAESLLAKDGWRDTNLQALLYHRQATYTVKTIGHGRISLDLYAKAAERLRQYAPDSDELLNVLMETAQSVLFSGLPDSEARVHAALTELRQRAHARYGEQHQIFTQAEILEARLLLNTGQAEQALQRLRATQEQLVHFSGENHNDVLALRYFEIVALLDLGKTTEADAVWQAADAQRQAYFSDQASMAEALAALRQQIDAAASSAGEL